MTVRSGSMGLFQVGAFALLFGGGLLLALRGVRRRIDALRALAVLSRRGGTRAPRVEGAARPRPPSSTD